MKKLLLVLAIGAFAACGGNNAGEGTSTDTVPATTTPVDTATTAPVDTTGRTADTTTTGTGGSADTTK
jgi:hypothetical protein